MWAIIWDIILGIKCVALLSTAHNLNYPFMMQSSKHILLYHIPVSLYTINKLLMEYILKTKSLKIGGHWKKIPQHCEESPKIGRLEHVRVSVFRFALQCPQPTTKDLVCLKQNCYL